MKKYFKRKSLEKAKKASVVIPFKGLKESKQALIIYRNTSPNKTGFVLLLENMLKEYNLSVSTFGFIPEKLKKGEERKAHYYYQNELNWLGNPRLEVVQELTSLNFDVVIDLDLENKSPNTFILLKVNAGLRVCFTNEKKGDYDLIIEKKDNQEEELVKQLEHYLNSIKKA